MLPQNNYKYQWYMCRECGHRWYGPVLDVSLKCPLDGMELVIVTDDGLSVGELVEDLISAVEKKENSGTKSLLEYADEVEQEFDMSGITSGIYRRVWLKAFARWQAAHIGDIPATCNDHVHAIMEEFTRDDFCQACNKPLRV